MIVSRLSARMAVRCRPMLFGCRLDARMFAAGSSDAVEFAFQNKDGSLTAVQVQKGMSLLDVAHKNGIDLEGACEASLACRYSSA